MIALRSLMLTLLLALSGSACTRTAVVLDRFPKLTARVLRAGVTEYGTVLASLGPPAELQATPRGFNFIYRSAEFKEANLTLSYRQAKVAYSSGDSRIRTLFMVFDHDGVLRSTTITDEDFDLGYGALGGHSLVQDSFFGRREYAPIARPHRWGASLLDSAPMPGGDVGLPTAARAERPLRALAGRDPD